MKLRMATLDDLPAIARLGRDMHEASSFCTLDYDEDVVKTTFGDLIDESQFVVLAENINGEVIGGMAGRVTPSWFGKDSIANDIAIFITPDERGGLRAVQFVKAFVLWARLAGAKQVRTGVTTGDARAEHLYAAMGFTRCGASFYLELADDSKGE
jgi:N-acetylglutamate synthase-like GNAT family acetyltransferase